MKKILKDIICYYKNNIKNISLNEIYKLEAIKCFENNWDINADDFYEMLKKSLSRSRNLLSSKNFFPKKMILYFAKKDPETVREMFVNLFNETISLSRRVQSFKNTSDILLNKYADETMKMHYQNLNVISTYLFLKFPEKYYIYREGKFKNFINKIEYGSLPRRGSFEILQAYYEICNQILEIIKKDDEILEICINRFQGMGFADGGLHLITEEIVYIGSKIEINNSKIFYSKKDFLNEVYIEEKDYDFLVRLLNRKKNIILQGAPGVGKTFLSKRLAYSILGEKDEDKIRFVQFHQNYSYEDFIIGYKPYKNGFKLKHGVFYDFCKKAKENPQDKYFFIIDEINRGNLSKIFGELMMLIENDYRDMEIDLAYGEEKFSVPKNLYIIGIMNTADRSIAMIDYALRRRFGFFNINPAFENNKFLEYIKGFNNEKIFLLIDKIKQLNGEIRKDFSLGEGFCIGHSYFLLNDIYDYDFIDDYFYEIVEFEIIPLLKEYWFDDYEKLDKWENILRNVWCDK